MTPRSHFPPSAQWKLKPQGFCSSAGSSDPETGALGIVLSSEAPDEPPQLLGVVDWRLALPFWCLCSGVACWGSELFCSASAAPSVLGFRGRTQTEVDRNESPHRTTTSALTCRCRHYPCPACSSRLETSGRRSGITFSATAAGKGGRRPSQPNPWEKCGAELWVGPFQPAPVNSPLVSLKYGSQLVVAGIRSSALADAIAKERLRKSYGSWKGSWTRSARRPGYPLGGCQKKTHKVGRPQRASTLRSEMGGDGWPPNSPGQISATWSRKKSRKGCRRRFRNRFPNRRFRRGSIQMLQPRHALS